MGRGNAMNLRSLSLTLCLALLMVSSSAGLVSSQDSRWSIVPGLRVGPLALNDADSKVFKVLGKPDAVCVGNVHPDSKYTITELYFPKRGLQIRIQQRSGAPAILDMSVSTKLEKNLVDRPLSGASYRTCTPRGKIVFEAPKNFYFTDRGLGLGATVQTLVAAHGAPLAVRPYGVGKAEAYYYPGVTFVFWNGALLDIIVRDPAFRP